MSPPYFIQRIENILCKTTPPLISLSVKYLWTEQLFYNWRKDDNILDHFIKKRNSAIKQFSLTIIGLGLFYLHGSEEISGANFTTENLTYTQFLGT